MDHPKPIVAVPAAIGGVAGGLVGVPLEIVFLPVGWAYGSFAPPPRKPYADDVPFLGMEIPSYVAATALGAPFWLAFGWWGIKGEDADDFGRPSDFLPQSFVSMLDGGARRKRAPIVTPTPVPEIAPPVSGHEGGIKR